MKKISIIALGLLSSASAALADPATLNVKAGGIENGAFIPEKFVFCVADAKTHTKDGTNINPEITWSKGPYGTRSYALIMHDTEVPTVFDDANKEDKTIPASLKRMDFYHWVLVDIAADRTSIKEGEDSKELNKSGKEPGKKAYGLSGKNSYGSFMKGNFGGYDGSCPPWNDEIMHKYYFTVYALDVASLKLAEDGKFEGKDALKAMEGHILAKGSTMGIYSQNPKVKK